MGRPKQILTPEQEAQRKARREEYRRQYFARPDVKEHRSKAAYARNHTPEGREKRRQESREYYLKNRDRVLANTKAYQKTERGKTLKRVNATKIRATPKGKAMAQIYTERYRSKPGKKLKIKLRNAKWYQQPKNKQAQKERNRRPENVCAGHARQGRYRARILGARCGDQAVILKWIKAWRAKAIVTCYWCGAKQSPKKCHNDHIVPLSRGGAHSIENLCISCAECNQKKNGLEVDFWNAVISQPVLL